MSDTLVDAGDLSPVERAHPAWARDEGFTFIGDWAGPMYAARRGWPISVDDGGIKAMDVDPETLARDAAELGCNCVVLSCHLDLSVATPQDPLELVRCKIEQAHKHGLRAGVYLRADYIVLEAANDEERKLGKFCQRDQRGLVPTWNRDCDYKKKLCYHNPEVLQHFKDRLHFAIKELGADFIHIDGYDFGGMEANDACRCDKCKEDFRGYLRGKYGHEPQKAIERFGHAGLDWIEPPTTYPTVTAPDAVRCPVWQEWIKFRCWFSAKIGQEIATQVQALNPEVAIEVNVGVPTQENFALLFGQDLPTMGRFTEGIWSEDGYWPDMTEDGTVITRIRQMKMVEACGNHFIAYVTSSRPQDERQARQSAAHMAAFNRGALGCVGFAGIMAGGMEYQRNFDAKRDVAQWIRGHREFYRATTPFSELAVWRSQCGLACAPRLSYAAFMQTEQLLIEDRMPFRIVFDEWLENPGPDRAVLLPAVDGLSRAQGQRIEQYVANGGGVLIGQGTGEFDLDPRRRLRPLLSELLAETEQVYANSFMALGHYGSGRVARIPQLVDPRAAKRPYLPDGMADLSLDLTNWTPPQQADRVRAALDWILGNTRRVTVDAPRGVLAEYRIRDGRLLVHLVNLRGEAALNIRLRVRISGARPQATAAVESPDEAGLKLIDVIQNGNELAATLPCLDVYAVVVVEPFAMEPKD